MSPHRCPACGVSQQGDRCTRPDCGYRPSDDPVQQARDWIERIRRQLNKGDNQ